MPGTEYQQSGQAARHIDRAVVNRSGPAGHKTLVKLVQQGVAKYQEQRYLEPMPLDKLVCRTRERARRKYSEHGVLGEMRQFARNEMDCRHPLFAKVRKNPKNQRPDHLRGIER